MRSSRPIPTRACGTISIPHADAVQPRPAGDPPAGRKRSTCCRSRCRPTSRSRASTTTKHTAILRQLAERHRGHSLRCAGRQDRIAGETQGARFDLRAARQMGDAARRQLSLHHQGRHAHRAGSGAFAISRKSRSVYNFVNDLCVKLGAIAGRSGAVREICRRRAEPDASGFGRARAQNGAPNIERADKLVQLIAKQKGLSHPAIDAHVALVDARLGRQPQEGALPR